jgi:hypothetical protein
MLFRGMMVNLPNFAHLFQGAMCDLVQRLEKVGLRTL